MKTQMQKIKQVAFMFVAAISVFSCSPKNSGSNTPVATTFVYQNGQCINSSTGQLADPMSCNGLNNGYSYVNGVCVQTATNQQVPITYCQQTGMNNGYSYINGVCVQTATNQQVPITYCQQTGGVGGGAISQQCSGQYQQGWCSIQTGNCRGWTLTTLQGQQVYCQ